jgi:hypothetical protein
MRVGLDMYLTANKKMYPDWKDSKKEDTDEIKKVRNLFPEMFKTGNLDYVSVGFEAGYWRKANHIHKWFVDNVQRGEDDCKSYYVDREDLKKLLDVVDKVLASCKLVPDTVINGYKGTEKGMEPMLEDGEVILDPTIAKKLLPVQEGFFFGGKEYDQWYHQNLKWTKETIEQCLKLGDEWSFEYHASW